MKPFTFTPTQFNKEEIYFALKRFISDAVNTGIESAAELSDPKKTKLAALTAAYKSLNQSDEIAKAKHVFTKSLLYDEPIKQEYQKQFMNLLTDLFVKHYIGKNNPIVEKLFHDVVKNKKEKNHDE